MLGWVTKSLSHESRKAIRAWKKQNKSYQEFQYNFFERTFVKLAQRPLKYSLGVLAFFSVLAIIPSVWQNNITQWFLSLSNYPEDTLSYLGALWSVQATIVGLVYPIVVGFVGLLLQNQSADKVILNTYLTDSSAIIMGLSSLLLVAFMGIQYCFEPYLTNFNFDGFMLANNLWFIFNVSGTAWFLYRTVEFIKPDFRQRNIKKYMINITLPLEIENLLIRHLFTNAASLGLLHSPLQHSRKNGEEPRVVMHSMFSDIGKAELNKSFRKQVVLQNVFFRSLNIACKQWLKRTELRDNLPEQSNNLFGMQERSQLFFTVLPGEVYEGKVSLCRMYGSTKLSPVEKLLVNISFNFKSHNEKEKSSISYDVQVGSQAEIIIAIDRGQIQRYQDAVHALEDMHILLVSACGFIYDNNQKDNWAKLAGSAFLSRKLYEEWNRVYLDVFDRAIAQLQYSTRFFHEIAYTPNALYNRTLSTATREISLGFMQLSYFLWLKLRKWWLNEVEKQGESSHGFASPSALSHPLQNTYREAIYQFIGAWECFTRSVLPDSKDEGPIEWKDYREFGGYFENHLNYTVLMLLNSVYIGDAFAAEWMLDVLQKWRAGLSHQLDFDYYRLERPMRFTLDSLSKTKQEIESILQDQNALFPNEQAPFEKFFATCISNYWRDAVCVTLYLLSLWTKDARDSAELPVRLIRALLSGQAQKEGGGEFISLKPISSATDLLQTIIRQYFYDGGYRQGYRNRLDSLAESAQSIGKPSMIPGRTYSSIGANDLESTQLGQLFILCLFVDSSWSPERQIESDLRDLIGTDDGLARNLEKLLQSYLQLLDNGMLDSYDAAYDLIQEAFSTQFSFDDARKTLRNGITSVLDILSDTRRQTIIDLPIDQNRLNEIANAANSIAFDKEKTAFPVNCFSRIIPIGDQLEARKLVLKKMSRGEFTDPLMAQLASNENAWLAETMKNHAAAVILSIVLRNAEVQQIQATTEKDYWAVLSEHSSRLLKERLSPILLLDNPTRPKWIYQWENARYERHSNLPKGLTVTRKKTQDQAYLCHFNEVAVYNAPIPYGSSFLLAKEIFEELRITDYGGEQYVDASIVESYDDETIVDLELRFGIDLKINKTPSFRLEYERLKD